MAHCNAASAVEFGGATDRTATVNLQMYELRLPSPDRLVAGGQLNQRTDMVKRSRAQYEVKYRAGVPTIVGSRSVPLAALAAPVAVAGS
jgi:hypothetical protein